jgi:hypothetical protein
LSRSFVSNTNRRAEIGRSSVPGEVRKGLPILKRKRLTLSCREWGRGVECSTEGESYVEPDLHITVKGLDETTGNHIGNCLLEIVCTFAEGENALDFRRMHRIIVTNDFAGELAELSTATASGNPIEHTNEEYAVAVAKVLLLPRGDEIEIVPVINAQAVVGLVSADPSYYESETAYSGELDQ